jgi:N-acetylglucosaminyl-diphospho-decaprenol L-rhamnosyltransferase
VDLAVIVVSANDARWLEPCLASVFAHAGDIALEVIVVDNASTDGTAELVRRRFPHVRLIEAPNLGFAAGCNRGLRATEARYALLLNPDTQILAGTFAGLLATLDADPDIGIAGVRQVGSDGALLATIRRFPSVARALGEALGSERWPRRPSWAGERVLGFEGERVSDVAELVPEVAERVADVEVRDAPVDARRDAHVYTHARDCDWVVGSFLLARRHALLAAGLLDERFFLYCEETDLCLRVARAGWRVRYLPHMTIRHHAGKGGTRPRLVAQEAFARRQYADKHFSPLQRALFLGALGMRHALRAPLRRGGLQALATLTGRSGAPFLAPPATALTPQATALAARCCEEASPRGWRTPLRGTGSRPEADEPGPSPFPVRKIRDGAR